MHTLLEGMKDPASIRGMTDSELEQLACEVRKRIIDVISATGGHLASSLGVVELTLALHAVFETPRDKIIWDVGHQSYTHKIITGRNERFASIRTYGGLSGFPKREESEHDSFNTGHASTSISAALGMALARDLREEKHEVIAVIGDGALTGGLAFEALNYAGDKKTDITVVLNDNKMSIDKNVGAMASYLSRLRTDPMYFKSKEEMESFLKKLPHGPRVLKLAERLKDSVKYLVVSGILFEELGFTYLGPIDGHNISEMKSVFKKARSLRGPVLIHVLTQKGKGYSPAEDKPGSFHGVGPFDVDTGTSAKKKEPPSYTSVFAQTITDLASENSSIVAISAAMPGGTGLDHFAEKFPERFFDVGIAEENAVTMAAGMAAKGIKPVVAIYSTFLQRAYDQVIHDVCLQRLPVVFALDRSGIVGEDGETHQGLFDLSYLRCVPNLIVMSPKDENELRHMLYTAIEHDGPVAVRYPRGKGLGAPLDSKLKTIPIGRAEILMEGGDLVILAVGNGVNTAFEVGKSLAQSGIQAAVVNSRFIKPLDCELVMPHVKASRRLVTLEENVLAGGFGAGVLELLNDNGLSNIEVLRIGIPDKFIEHGHPDIIREKYGLTHDGVFKSIQDAFFGTKSSVQRR